MSQHTTKIWLLSRVLHKKKILFRAQKYFPSINFYTFMSFELGHLCIIALYRDYCTPNSKPSLFLYLFYRYFHNLYPKDLHPFSQYFQIPLDKLEA